MVRSPEQMRAIIDGNPFKAEAEDHPSHVIVNFLKTPLPKGDEDGPARGDHGAGAVRRRRARALYRLPDQLRRQRAGPRLEEIETQSGRHHAATGTPC
jgi:hypothetical protein